MMENPILDLIQFYQRELESTEAQKALAKLQISNPEVVQHFKIGFCSGKALSACSPEQIGVLTTLGLIFRKREIFIGSIILPVQDEQGQLVDIVGLRSYRSGLRYLNWQKSPMGLVGIESLPIYSDHLILCDNVFHALHIRQHGFLNVVAIRNLADLKSNLPLFEKHQVKKIYLVSRSQRQKIVPMLKKIGVEVVVVKTPMDSIIIPKESLEIIGKEPAQPKKPVPPIILLSKSESRIVFGAGDVQYQLDSAAMVGIGMKALVKVVRGKVSFLDKLDLASSSQRNRFSKVCGMKIGVQSGDVETHLDQIADALDRLTLEAAQESVKAPKVLTADEEREARELMGRDNFLNVQVKALERYYHIIGEEANKKVLVLIAASRLLDKPLGGILRGAASSGKSSLMLAVSRLLSPVDVMLFSRLTPQSLFYLPKDALSHKLLIIDEYAGIEDCEYALRTAMSSQSLSLAITVRNGGRLPVTRSIEIPATVAILVSSTMPVDTENLSRFIEIKTDSSPAQTARVVQELAKSYTDGHASDGSELQTIQNANRLLKPCKVSIPFAEKLAVGAKNVTARRRFAQVMGLISAHAALLQTIRDAQTLEDGTFIVQASKSDYRGVWDVLKGILDEGEEGLSPSASELLRFLQKEAVPISIKLVMDKLAWSYSKVYRTLNELTRLSLVFPDRLTNGIERKYEIAPYIGSEGQSLPDPDSI